MSVEPGTYDQSHAAYPVLYVLQYYACFRHPVTPAEIAGSSPGPLQPAAIADILEELVAAQKVFTSQGYYSILKNIDQIVARRIQGNVLAEQLQPKAAATGRFIARFPFVRFVGISGSLSKGYAERGVTDFDFFIITAPNRLWICRTLLHLFKKLTFLAGMQGHFCMNYFIDTERLCIEERNFYTAIEISSLVPVYGTILYKDFIQRNTWKNGFLPNGYKQYFPPGKTMDASPWYKRAAESILNLLSPSKLNRFLMQLTDKWWRRKWARKNFPADQYELAFKTTLHQSKNHPANYQKKIMDHMQLQGTKKPAETPADIAD